MRWSKLDLEEARRLYNTGLSFAQIGQRLGYTKSYLSKRFRAAGIATLPSGRPVTTPAPVVDVADLVRRREAGESFSAIARALGIGHDLARDRYLRATGQPRRTAERRAEGAAER